jgi:N-acetylglucosaminyl-diphospho-decaprenol L-rhamnosyltransferase
MKGEPTDPIRISVITVSYKSAVLIESLLQSLASERNRESSLEITAVVVDNASGDTPAIGEAIAREGWSPWVTLITAERNGGFAYGNNVGLDHVYRSGLRPDYFFLLNPDCEVRPQAIRGLIDFLEAHPEAGTAGPSLEYADGEPFPYAYRFPSWISEINHGLGLGLFTRLVENRVVVRKMGATCEEVDWYPGAAMMVRREVIDELGGMDEGYFLYYEETDFCLKVKRAGWSNWYVPSSRVVHLAGQSTGISNAKGHQRLPKYWFESRRRFFTKNMGPGYAIAADVALVLAWSAGRVKLRLQRRDLGRPYFVTDLVRNSPLLSANRALAPIREYRPPRRARSA